jgi:hypothetical protein
LTSDLILPTTITVITVIFFNILEKVGTKVANRRTNAKFSIFISFSKDYQQPKRLRFLVSSVFPVLAELDKSSLMTIPLLKAK